MHVRNKKSKSSSSISIGLYDCEQTHSIIKQGNTEFTYWEIKSWNINLNIRMDAAKSDGF